jgi:hypothetical protein
VSDGQSGLFEVRLRKSMFFQSDFENNVFSVIDLLVFLEDYCDPEEIADALLEKIDRVAKKLSLEEGLSCGGRIVSIYDDGEFIVLKVS